MTWSVQEIFVLAHSGTCSFYAETTLKACRTFVLKKHEELVKFLTAQTPKALKVSSGLCWDLSYSRGRSSRSRSEAQECLFHNEWSVLLMSLLRIRLLFNPVSMFLVTCSRFRILLLSSLLSWRLKHLCNHLQSYTIYNPLKILYNPLQSYTYKSRIGVPTFRPQRTCDSKSSAACDKGMPWRRVALPMALPMAASHGLMVPRSHGCIAAVGSCPTWMRVFQRSWVRSFSFRIACGRKCRKTNNAPTLQI